MKKPLLKWVQPNFKLGSFTNTYGDGDQERGYRLVTTIAV